jgi:adenosine deaminase
MVANERKVCFDIALSSNLYTGIVKDIKQHPITDMLEAGCIITIGTDDPAVLETTIDKEYKILMNELKIPEETVIELMTNSVKHAFTDLSGVLKT